MEQDENTGALPVIVSGAVVRATGEEVFRARHYAGLSKSPRTIRSYETEWAAFCAWCAARSLEPLPANAATVAVFLSHEADRGCAPPTILCRLAAIAHMHKRFGHVPPQKSEGGAAIEDVMAGIRRSWKTLPGKKSALDADLTWQVIHHITGDSLRARRDRALLAVGMASALRRSELVALRVEDIERAPSGIRLTIRRSKTDQEGGGQVIAVPDGRRIRPVALLDAWISAGGIEDGYVFRRFLGKKDRLTDLPMDDAAVALLVKRRAAAAGLDARLFSGHSLRAGFITSAAEAGASVWKIQEVSRHKSVDVLSGYVRTASQFKDHAGDGFL